MRCFLVSIMVLWSGLIDGSAARADDGGDIRQVIPADAAMMRTDFMKLATDQSGPDASGVKDKSLTLMLLDLRIKDDEESNEEFRFLTDGSPKPSMLASELLRERRTGERRILLEPVTFIHADRITDFTCEVNGDKAAGTVSFKVPELYEGKVKYVAQKLGGQWFISEFFMPAYGIHLVRGGDGLWKQKD